VAHRALVAYERPDGRYDVHTARWGGFEWLVSRITAADPYADGAVDATPRVVARPFGSVRTMLDFAHHETLYRVDTGYAVEAYLPLWLDMSHYLGAPPEVDTDPEGLLVAVDSATEAARIRRWLRAAKGTLAEAVAADCLDAAAAHDVLVRATRRRVGERALDAPECGSASSDSGTDE
jgi:hypothetical protein